MRDLGGFYVATVTSYRGRTFRVFAAPETIDEPAGYVFRLEYLGLGVMTGASLKLWPTDLIVPVRQALADRRDIDMRRYKKDERERRRNWHVIVTPDEDAETLARELGILP